MSTTYETIRYETTPDRVATITLDRPNALNAFDRQMCEEVRSAWQRIKAVKSGNRVKFRKRSKRAARFLKSLAPITAPVPVAARA